MTGMREIEWEDCLLEPQRDAELELRFAQMTHRPPGTMRYFSGVSWIGEAMIVLSLQLETRLNLEADLCDMIGLIVSQDNSCRYCFGATRAFLRILGMPESRIVQLEHELLAADLDSRERAALDFSRRVSRSNPLPTESDKNRLREVRYREIEIVELAAASALHLFFNRAATLLALPPEPLEELPDRWYMRLIRPVLAVRLRKIRRKLEPKPLQAEEKTGPFSALVVALDPLPLAGEMRVILDAMLDSKLLSRKAKLLIFAVVARALGSEGCEREAVRLLAEDGLPRETTDEVLAHLASATLDPIESLVVPFARETVWYQPARLQRRARELLSQLSREQFLEFVIVVSLANALCRLEVIVDRSE